MSLSLSLSSKPSVQMEQLSHQALYSLGQPSTLSGLMNSSRTKVFSKCFSTAYYILLMSFSIGTSDNGWTSDWMCEQWFIHHFIPYVRAKAGHDEEWILVTLDGHGSHLTLAMSDAAIAAKIHILPLIPHTTHKCQPLDVGPFGPVQHGWANQCDIVLEETGLAITKHTFIQNYLEVRKGA